MTMLTGVRRALLGVKRLGYILRATFNAPDQGYADAQVLDTDAEGIQDGQLTVVEVDGTLAVVSNKLAFTAQGTPTWGDLGVYSQAITRALGRGLLSITNMDATDKGEGHGWQSVTDVALANTVYWRALSGAGNYDIYVLNGSENPTLFSYAAATDYEHAIVLGGFDSSGNPYYAGQAKASYDYGAWYFIKGGAFSTWTLLWVTTLDNTATLYAVFSSYQAAGTLDDFRVPDRDLSSIQVPMAYSSFTAGNGTSLDAITPEVGGGWTEQSGDWDIQTNRANPDGAAIATVSAPGAADGLVDCTVNGGAGDNPAIDLRYSDANNYWYLQADRVANQLELHEYNATVDTVRANAAVVINDNTDYAARAIMYGQTIDGFLDGGNKITYALAALNETSIIHGIRAENTAGEFDNFVAYPRTSSQFDAVLGGV